MTNGEDFLEPSYTVGLHQISWLKSCLTIHIYNQRLSYFLPQNLEHQNTLHFPPNLLNCSQKTQCNCSLSSSAAFQMIADLTIGHRFRTTNWFILFSTLVILLPHLNNEANEIWLIFYVLYKRNEFIRKKGATATSHSLLRIFGKHIWMKAEISKYRCCD